MNTFIRNRLPEKEEGLAKIREANLFEYGVFHEPLCERLERAQKALQKAEGKALAFGLNNNDFDHSLLKLLAEDSETVFYGMVCLTELAGADSFVLYLPENETEIKIAAEEALKVFFKETPGSGPQVISGIIPVRKYDECSMFHLETAYEAGALLLNGTVPDLPVFIKDAEGGTEAKRIPCGTALKDLLDLSQENLKAVQIGTRLYTKEEAENFTFLKETNIGNGVIRRITDKMCLLLEAEQDILASRTEGCGKCTFCREGLIQLAGFLADTKAGKGSADQLDLMAEIGEAMDFSSRCSIGMRGADFILDSLGKFKSEYLAHLKKTCPAGICFTNEKMYIDPAKCVGCGACMAVCEDNAIEGRKGYTHLIDRTLCTLCGKCLEVCVEGAVIKTDGPLPKIPEKSVKVGRAGRENTEEKAETKTRRRIRRPAGSTAPAETTDTAAAANTVAQEPFDLEKYLQEAGNMKTYDTELCVIAGGPAGLAAAVQAAENGAKVIVLEKSSAVGGAANMGMGPLGIGTKYQKQQMVDITVEKAFNMFMEYTHYQVDARLIKRYFSQSGETIDWLENMGVEFEGAYRYFPQSECTWHIVKSGQKIGPRAASFMNKAMYERALSLGVTFLLETRAEHIIKEDDAVVGVLAVTSSGENIRVNCKAAIIATGGAGGNPEMIKQETGYTFGKDMFNFAIPGITGDGLRMAWEAGVDHMQVRVEQAAMMVGVDDLPDSVSNIFFQPNLLVNAFGRRFMNEEYMQNTTYLSNAVSYQKDRTSYSIVDSSIVRNYIRNGVDVVSMVRSDPDVSDFYDGIKMAQENGNQYPVVADTIEELAQKLGVDPETLKETVDQYNEYCDTTDQEFYKTGRYLKPIYMAPFYACKIGPGGYGTVGGIRINENCEACDKDFYPIPGLYAAGADACNIYNDSYMFLLPGNSMGFAVNTGRIAGMEAAAYIQELKEE